MNDIKRHIKIRNNLTNRKFGKLLCIKPTGEFRNSAREWLCKCDCGNEHKATANHLVCGNIKSCGCISRQENSKHKNWTGYAEISGRYFAALKQKAVERNLEFSISIEYLWGLFEKQNKLCKLTNVPIKFASSAKRKAVEQTASLDRIDSSKGYIEGNVQWIHKDVNFMKQDFSETEFYNWCKKVVINNYRYYESLDGDEPIEDYSWILEIP